MEVNISVGHGQEELKGELEEYAHAGYREHGGKRVMETPYALMGTTAMSKKNVLAWNLVCHLNLRL